MLFHNENSEHLTEHEPHFKTQQTKLHTRNRNSIHLIN